jgi:copper(I)-binding protein
MGTGHVGPRPAVALADHEKAGQRPLLRVQSPVAAKVELHAAGIDQPGPKPVAALSVGAPQDLVLSPSGPHLAMLGLKRTLFENQTFKLALEFDGAGRIIIDVIVGPPAPSTPHHTDTRSGARSPQCE